MHSFESFFQVLIDYFKSSVWPPGPVLLCVGGSEPGPSQLPSRLTHPWSPACPGAEHDPVYRGPGPADPAGPAVRGEDGGAAEGPGEQIQTGGRWAREQHRQTVQGKTHHTYNHWDQRLGGLNERGWGGFHSTHAWASVRVCVCVCVYVCVCVCVRECCNCNS